MAPFSYRPGQGQGIAVDRAGPATALALGLGGGEAVQGAVADELPLDLGHGGEQDEQQPAAAMVNCDPG
jgi:hypothetical protein